MRVLMLGWEFPPFITGGLGTACYGLTKALSRRQTDVTFVLPKTVDGEFAEDLHVRLLTQQAPAAAVGDRSPESVASTYSYKPPIMEEDTEAFEHVTFKAVPARFSHPYPGSTQYVGEAAAATSNTTAQFNRPMSILDSPPPAAPSEAPDKADRQAKSTAGDYSGDLVSESRRYAALCIDLAHGEDFDVVHAHDWLTFPAGMAVAAVHGIPLVVHIHSTEFDRAGEHIHHPIYDVERRGVHAAMRVIAVSHLTKNMLVNRYSVEPDKIDVVYNGIEELDSPIQADTPESIHIDKTDKVVLFLGRITMQKGPEVFISAAKKVLQKYDKVKFIMAGAGDKVRDIIELAAREGIGHKITFTGFVRGEEVSRVFKMADVFVMPSVSEPFGLAALEAINHDVPVIMSKTAGASEVLKHVLKVDFWDVDEIANKIIALLRHESLGSELRSNADLELRHLTWDGAAQKCLDVYQAAVDAMPT